jgi:aspartyl-tRNA(Asn)/glutamyl-tRNA(Gln) amidotransferase subunit A
VRGPAAQTGITSMKATHGRVPMTGIWPRAPRRFWHVGPMARLYWFRVNWKKLGW